MKIKQIFRLLLIILFNQRDCDIALYWKTKHINLVQQAAEACLKDTDTNELFYIDNFNIFLLKFCT